MTRRTWTSRFRGAGRDRPGRGRGQRRREGCEGGDRCGSHCGGRSRGRGRVVVVVVVVPS